MENGGGSVAHKSASQLQGAEELQRYGIRVRREGDGSHQEEPRVRLSWEQAEVSLESGATSLASFYGLVFQVMVVDRCLQPKGSDCEEADPR